MDKARWIKMFKDSGMNEVNMLKWHEEFEANAPEAHQDFLESLGIAPGEMERMRSYIQEKLKKK